MNLVCGSTGQAEADIGLLRQWEIVALLRLATLDAMAFTEYVKDLFRRGVLTQEVCGEVRDVFCEKGLANPACEPLRQGRRSSALAQSAGSQFIAPKAFGPDVQDFQKSALLGEPAIQVAKPVSRFEQDFETTALLGRGGFGEVWQARNRVDQREYAVKVVPYSYQLGEDPLQHPALVEAQAWAALRHPNIVRYHSAWVEIEGAAEVDLPLAEGRRGSALAQPGFLALPQGNLASSGNDSSIEDTISFAESDGGIVFAASTKESVDQTVSVAENQQEQLQIVPQQPNMRMHQQMQKPPPAGRAKLHLQMELVPNGTLADWIARRNAKMCVSGATETAIPELHIFSQLLEVVSHLHSQGLVHRDIKPANILLAENGSVRLSDFGLIKATAVAQQVALEDGRPGGGADGLTKIVGTPSYAAPEQMQGRRCGPEADIFALGMVLVELLYPVETRMEHAALFEQVRAQSMPPAPGAELVDPLVATYVSRMTSPNPQDRPSAAELKAYVQQYACKQREQQLESFSGGAPPEQVGLRRSISDSSVMHTQSAPTQTRRIQKVEMQRRREFAEAEYKAAMKSAEKDSLLSFVEEVSSSLSRDEGSATSVEQIAAAS